jgi:hypothetical protein
MERFGNFVFPASLSTKVLHAGRRWKFSSSRRSDNADGLSRRLVAAECNEDGSQAKAGLSRRSITKTEALVFAGWENVAEIFGKFGGADQLRNAVP